MHIITCQPLFILKPSFSHPEHYLAGEVDHTEKECYESLNRLTKDETFPFSQEQAVIFHQARSAQCISQTGLGPCGYGTIILAPTALTAASIWAGNVVAPIAVFATVIFSNLASMAFTGSFPSWDSDQQNRDQNVLNAMEERFNNLGDFLLYEYAKDKAKMIELASKINVALIKSKITQVTTQTDRENAVLEHFETCINYIKNPEQTKNQESGNMRFIDALSRRGLLPLFSSAGLHTSFSRRSSVA